MNINNLVGLRCLLTVKEGGYGSHGEVTEYKVLEVSPSGNWVKLQNLYGNKFWRPVTGVSFVEELIDFKPEKPPEMK